MSNIVDAYIALGSNMGDRRRNLDEAVRLLGDTDGVTVVKVSRYVETDPVGYTDQDTFLNGAVHIKTTRSPHELLGICLGIEDALGRIRTVHWGPRNIDLDVLLYGDETIDTPDLKIPHPLMQERAFVLVPLAEIAPDAVHPVTGLTVEELLDEYES